MKTIRLTLTVFILCLISMFAYAQPGNPCNGCDPDALTTGAWNLSASDNFVPNGSFVTITATYAGGSCPSATTITVGHSGGGACLKGIPSSRQVTTNCGQTSIVVGDFSLTNNCGQNATKNFTITNITNGHSAGSGTSVEVDDQF